MRDTIPRHSPTPSRDLLSFHREISSLEGFFVADAEIFISADYENYLKPAAVPPDLVSSSCRIVLLDYTPKSNRSLSMAAMNWIDLVATKGGRLVPAREIFTPPTSLYIDKNWLRTDACKSEEGRLFLDRAEEEKWTSHIVIMQSPSSDDPAPPTFKSVLAQLGLNGTSKEALGNYVKIVSTTWLSACGAERTPCAESAHELFQEERRRNRADRESLAKGRGRDPGERKEVERSQEDVDLRRSDVDSADEDEVEVERVQLNHWLASTNRITEGKQAWERKRMDERRECYQHLVPAVESDVGW